LYIETQFVYSRLLRMNDITYFAETNYRNQRTRFGIKQSDRRRHMYIIGKTGTGKTTLLDNMTVQDIQQGKGVAVIDPHGEYAERMLSFVPRERIDDVVYFNPADLDHPLGFNMLEKPKPEMRHFVASGLMGVFKKLWPDVWSARMEYFLSNSILAHLEREGSTLIGVNRIFGDKEYRKRVVSEIHDPIVKAFWENEFAKLPEQFMREAVAAIQNKVGQFISNPLIRNIIGQTGSTFNLREIMDKKKILIANLAKGKVGEENAKLLGAMLVTQIYLAAMSRVDLPEEEREDFYVYVDEFQNFATESFASILSEARKYHLNLTLAHQYMGQLIDDKTKSAVLRDAILGNVGTMISFRIGAEDAEVLEKEFQPDFLIQDFVSLGFANIYLKLMIDNVASRPFSAVTLPPIPAPPENYSQEILLASRERYGHSAVDIERSISDWSGFSLESLVRVPLSQKDSVVLPAQPRVDDSRSTRESAQPAPDTSHGPAPSVSRGSGSSVSSSKVKMYPAKCAVDGADIMVPFQPDGRRPVYCTEHLAQIQRGGGQSQSAGSRESIRAGVKGRESQEARPSSPSGSNPVVRSQESIPPLSLYQLPPRDTASKDARGARQADNAGAPPRVERNQMRRGEGERERPHPPVKKQVNLDELRKVLQESIAGTVPVVHAEPTPREEPATARSPSESVRDTVPPAPPLNSSGVIQPGEPIKF